jgi:calpain-15
MESDKKRSKKESKKDTKTITYPNGTTLTKTKNGNTEKWVLDNKSLAKINFKMDLSKCKNVRFEKEKYKDKTTRNVKVNFGTKKKLFNLIKTPPFVFKPKFSKKETQIDIELQRQIMKPVTDGTEVEAKAISEEMMKLPFEVMDVDEIVKVIKKKGFPNFIDAHFLPNDISIYNPLKQDYPYKKVVHWRRPKDFMKGKPKVFSDEIDPNDIKQGFLGNCWFLCAVASLAERPALVKRLFITKEYNKEGIYRLKICKNGEWVTVTIDDYIPCYYNAGPMFAHSNGDELWVLLLEKAYAKLHGNYIALKSGFSYHAMIDLTGCPTEHLRFPKNNANFEDVEDEANEIFEKMLEYDEEGYMISASTPGKDKLTTGGGKKPKAGLVPGHAYSIIQVKHYEEEDIKLINIRNPWGKFEWDGDWSDNDKLWTEDMIDYFEPVLDDHDGSFWMSLEDFFPRFKSVSFCEVKNWEELRLRGKFIKVSNKDSLDQDYVISKFFYSFDIEEDETEVIIGIHQEDKRSYGSHLRPYLDASFILLKRSEDEDDEEELVYYDHAEFSRDRELFKKIIFEEGSYVVVPFTSGALLQKLNEKPDKEKGGKSLDLKTTLLKEATTQILAIKQYYQSTGLDVFRKIDLTANGILSAKELNQFGNIIGNKKFQNVKQSDFTSKKYEKVSCTKEGITRYGFLQFMMTNFTKEEVEKLLLKLGYDANLRSLKSRVFVVTFHSSEPLTIKINDILEGNVHKTAGNILIDNFFSEGGDNSGRSYNSH